MHDDAKEELEDLRQQLRDSKDPEEQLRANSARLTRLESFNEDLNEKMCNAIDEEEAVAKQADEYRSRIVANTLEIEKTLFRADAAR